jgi:L-fucose isomerase-like protein
MTYISVIAVLPVGELDTDPIKIEFEAILRAFKLPGIELSIANPVADEESARRSVAELSKRNPDLLVIIALRGLSAQVIEAAALASHVPCLLCPVQGRFALPSSALAIGALREANVPVELLYAPSYSPGFSERLNPIVKAARAFSRLKTSRIGVAGGLFPNLVSCRYDPQVIYSRLGVSLLPISFDAIRSSIQNAAGNLQILEQSREEITRLYKVELADIKSLEAGINLHLALKQIAAEQNLDGFAAECWSAFPQELGLNPCMGFIEDKYALACEGDVMLCIALLIVRYLNATSAYVGDLFDLDLDGILTLTHCGAPASLAATNEAILLGKSQIAEQRGFETLTCRPQLQNGPVTIFRFYGHQCDKLHLAAGELIDCEQSPNLAVKVRIEGHRWDFLDQCLGNHYLVVAGDIRNELKLLCKWLRITIFET